MTFQPTQDPSFWNQCNYLNNGCIKGDLFHQQQQIPLRAMNWVLVSPQSESGLCTLPNCIDMEWAFLEYTSSTTSNQMRISELGELFGSIIWITFTGESLLEAGTRFPLNHIFSKLIVYFNENPFWKVQTVEWPLWGISLFEMAFKNLFHYLD